MAVAVDIPSTDIDCQQSWLWWCNAVQLKMNAFYLFAFVHILVYV